MAQSTPRTAPAAIDTYLEEGLRILAILLVWGILAAFFTFLGDRTGLIGDHLLAHVGNLLLATGVLNAVLYLIYRGIDHWASTQNTV